MTYLIVVAHPDDEVLGAGASIRKFVNRGDVVDVCIMSAQAKARAHRPDDSELFADAEKSSELLGVRKNYFGDFPNIEMNNVSHLKLVQFIEKAIAESAPDVVITHHPSDVNNDHLHTSLACQAAIRLFQRKPGMKPISEFWYMEVLSSTEWSVNTATNRFSPNLYVETGKEGIECKISALEAYRGVMRPYPHPRSREAIEGLAAYRGSQAGCNYAEAFECVLRRLV